MWIVGDAVFLSAMLFVMWGWMRAEERGEARADRLAEAEMVGSGSASVVSPSTSPRNAGSGP